MSSIYDIGDRPRTTWTIMLDGAVVDPPTVMLIVEQPDDTAYQSIYGLSGQPYPITRSSAGIYYADIPLLTAGRWTRRWIAFDELGSPLDAVETAFRVRASALTTPLGTLP